MRPQNDIHGDTLDKFIYNLNIDLCKFLRKISVVENTQDKIVYIQGEYVHFPRI